MGGYGNASSNADATNADKENCFRKLIRQRLMGSEDCFIKHRVVGRYYVAAMLFIAVTIYFWSFMNILINANVGRFAESTPFYPALRNSSETEKNVIFYGFLGLEICVQIPGALLIYTISSHKFLTAALAISSIIHMLTPLAVNYGTLIFAVYSQKLVLAPLRIAVLAMWKDWASPKERKKFVILSLFIWITLFPTLQLFFLFVDLLMTKASFYVSGVCGLVWSLLWFFTVSDKPAEDSQVIRERDICLQNNTFSVFKGMPKLSEVPWKSILTSVPVFSLCLLYFKIGSSHILINPLNDFLLPGRVEDLGINPGVYQLLFMPIYIVVFFISALITDFLNRKHPGMIKARKLIICGALIIHIILLCGILINNITVAVVCLWISVIILSTSFTGIFTNALELSSQYVSIIGGLIETSFLLGLVLSIYCMDNLYYVYKLLQLNISREIVPYYEIGFTTIVAVVFYIWGSLEEQPWSLNNSSGQEDTRPQSYPVQEELELREAVPL